MNKYINLIKNLGLLTIGTFGTKLLTFFLVPFYTNILTTEEYGTFDLVNTIIALLLPIATLNIAEGVLRFSVGKTFEEQEKVLTIGLKNTLYGIGYVGIFLAINNFLFNNNIIFLNSTFIIVLFVFQSFNQILVYFARGINDIVCVSICGLILSSITILLNVLFLGIFKLGLWGYFVSTIIGYAVSCIIFCLRLKIWNYISISAKDDDLERKIRKYCIPLIFNTVGWWINNASDRLIVTWLCGVEQNGIYSVAYKIPAILTTIQNIFNQVWILSSVQEFDKNDKSGFFKNIYSYSNSIVCFICFLLIVFSKYIAKIMFSKDFYQGWIFSPFLTIAVVFGTLSGVMGGIFSSVNMTKIVGFSTCCGAVINIILNILLVFYMGPIGAAIATVVSGIVVWLIRMVKIKSIINIKINYFRNMLTYVVLFLQTSIVFLVNNAIVYFIISGCFSFLLLVLIFNDIKTRKNIKVEI